MTLKVLGIVLRRIVKTSQIEADYLTVRSQGEKSISLLHFSVVPDRENNYSVLAVLL